MHEKGQSRKRRSLIIIIIFIIIIIIIKNTCSFVSESGKLQIQHVVTE